MQLHDPHRRRRLIIVFAVIAVIAAIGIALRMQASWALRAETKETAVPVVVVVKAKQGPQTEELVLPATIKGWHEATIYARTNGYVKEWYTKMGTRVHEGELLALIETPELDAQLRQIEADLKTAEANSQLAQTTAQRWKALLAMDAVSKQEADEKSGDAKAKAAALAAARASRDRLKELSAFKRVVAPFDGVISSRLLDVGLLVTDGALGAQQELFHIVQPERLLVYVSVPQNYTQQITPGIEAEMHFAEHPGKSYPVQLRSTADAIDPTTRTLLVSFQADNPDGELLSGGYAEMHLKLPAKGDSIRLPVNTLIFRAEGLQVATVDADGHALLKPVHMGRDFGNEVEVLSGIDSDESVIINPPDSLIAGQAVRIATPAEKKDETKDEKKP